MNLSKAIVMAGDYVWQQAEVVIADGQMMVYVRNEGGGLDLDTTFSNVGGYSLSGQTYTYSPADGTVITDDDGEGFDKVKVLVKRRCGCK